MPLDLEPTFQLSRLDESEMALFAQLLAVVVRPGDVIALEGEVGAGKTTFARAFIRALLGGRNEEIPSPTYTLVQTYMSDRMPIAHFDLYRLSSPFELVELGLEDALVDGVAVIEWPSNAGDELPASRLHIHLANPDESVSVTTPGPGKKQPLYDRRDDDKRESGTRDLSVVGVGEWAERCRRLGAMHELILKAGDWKSLRSISYLAGDASARRYARLTRNDGRRTLLMDWPHVEDTKIVLDGKTYNQLAHIADNVVAFIGVASALCSHRFSAPEILGFDVENGLIILEDLGDQVFFDEVHAGADMEDLWQAATDTLVELRSVPVAETIPVAGASAHALARFDRGAMWSEVELLADWYWPYVHGTPMGEEMRARFRSIWNGVIDRLELEPSVWVMRDYHSPNLVWMAERSGKRKVGIIDFQDAVGGPAAYDLVSLLQDARVDVPAELEAKLLKHYSDAVSAREPEFDGDAFKFSYGAMGAQRNTKILGIFARLAKRDGKPHYLAHIPRIWGYLNRNLQHPDLFELASWYEEAFARGARPRIKD